MLTKHSILALTLLGLCGGAASAETVMSDNDMVLYSLGYELGKDIKGQALEYKQEIIQQGVNDAMAGNEPLFDKSVQRQALASIRKQRAENSLREAEAFLAENAKKPGVIKLESGLQYKILTTGTGKIPGPKDTVTAAFRGTLIDGTEFESTYQHGKPAKFEAGKPIKGLAEALTNMPTGSKWEIFIPPALAFGDRVVKKPGGLRIPANSAVIYEIELLSVETAAETSSKIESTPTPAAGEPK